MLMYKNVLEQVLNPMLLKVTFATFPGNFFNKEPIQRFLLLDFFIYVKNGLLFH